MKESAGSKYVLKYQTFTNVAFYIVFTFAVETNRLLFQWHFPWGHKNLMLISCNKKSQLTEEWVADQSKQKIDVFWCKKGLMVFSGILERIQIKIWLYNFVLTIAKMPRG